jgi:hypothetical protein
MAGLSKAYVWLLDCQTAEFGYIVAVGARDIEHFRGEEKMGIVDIVDSAKEVLDILDAYHNPPGREMLIDAALFSFLRGRFGNVQRQHRVYVYGSKKPKRIDFRYGGSNPIVVEFAVRPPTGGGELYGSQNVSELRKLCRVSHTEARLRALLLLDLYHEPIRQKALHNTYASINAGRGRFKRSAVRVIYVHRDLEFSFSWKPYKIV